jgi:CheY-like chemotaxis protein
MLKYYSIVIADDDEDDHFFLQEAISKYSTGHKITSVYNGQQLIELLNKQHEEGKGQADFVILDLNMPLVDGFQALTKIRSLANLQDIPVYVFSTSKDQATVIKAKKLGATEYFPKPTDMRRLRGIVEEIFSLQNSARNIK